MKKVDVIFPNYINAAIGPTGTLRRLLKNKEYLRARGYELEIFTYDYLVSNGKSAEVDFSKGLTFRSKLSNGLGKIGTLLFCFYCAIFVMPTVWSGYIKNSTGNQTLLYSMRRMLVMLI